MLLGHWNRHWGWGGTGKKHTECISNPRKTDRVFKTPSMHFATLPSPAWCISTGRLNLFSSPGKVFLEIDYHRVIIDVSFKSFSCRCLCVLKHTCVWPRLGYDKEEVLLACAGKKLVLIFPHSHWFSAQHTARRLYYDFCPILQFWSSHAFLTLFQCFRGKAKNWDEKT